MKTESKIYRLLLEIIDEHDPEASREEIRRLKQMPSLKVAIKTAAKSRKEDGTCYSHQRRVFGRPAAIPTAVKLLLAAETRIKVCTSFDQLLKLIVSLIADVVGIGPLYCYDVAIRIGAFLGHLPKKIYLHAGARTGAKLLGLPTERGFLDVAELPEILRVFKAHEIEDILCHLANSVKHSKRNAPPC
jgi:hypothetical protein